MTISGVVLVWGSLYFKVAVRDLMPHNNSRDHVLCQPPSMWVGQLLASASGPLSLQVSLTMLGLDCGSRSRNPTPFQLQAQALQALSPNPESQQGLTTLQC